MKISFNIPALTQMNQTGLSRQAEVLTDSDFVEGDEVKISEEGKILSRADSMKQRDSYFNVIESMIEKDPELAEKMAKGAAYAPDLLYINTKPGELQNKPLNEFYYADGTSVENRGYVSKFTKEAADIRLQRIKIYEVEKARGTSDVDIYKMLQEFKANLPVDYRNKIGLP